MFDDQIGQSFSLHTSSIDSQHYWTFVTANLVHTNTAHLLLNLAGVAVLWAVHGYSYVVTNYLFQFIIFGVAVTIGMFLFSSNITWYVGLSGILHGVFVVGAYQDIRHKIKFGWWLMLGIWLKIAYEQYFGANQTLKNLIEANVAVDAHLYGAMAGTIWVLASTLLATRKPA